MTAEEFVNAAKSEMLELGKELFPICRSITGDGFRESLAIVARHMPLRTTEVASGTRVFDWTVPQEWNIRDAWIKDPDGRKIIDFKENNLHVVSYSEPFRGFLDRESLNEHLFSLEDLPDAIPYVTSYYKRRWGFCTTHRQRMQLTEGDYEVYIDSELADGGLTYGEAVLDGKSDKVVLISTYLCHPSMANNELSGPIVSSFLYKYLQARSDRRYTYHFVVVPETIGSITFISRNLDYLKNKVICGFNLSCIGDERAYSMVASPSQDTLADKVAHAVLSRRENFVHYSFLDRGSDERQYCAPRVKLPLVTLCRSKFGEYDEYHTSLDNFDLVTENGLGGGLDAAIECIELLENNGCVGTTVNCEPQMGKRGLYPTTSTRNARGDETKLWMDILAHADGKRDLAELSTLLARRPREVIDAVKLLEEHGLLDVVQA